MKNILLLMAFVLLLPTHLVAEDQIQEKVVPSNVDIVVKKTEEPLVLKSKPDEIRKLRIKPKEIVRKTARKVVPEQCQGEINDFRIVKATEWNAYATIAIAILTIILAWETVRLRRLQAKQIENLNKEAIKPKIELYLDSNKYSRPLQKSIPAMFEIA